MFSKSLNNNDKISLILFTNYPNRLKIKDIESILRPKYKQLITSNIKNIKKKEPPLIHQNNDGITLTRVGMKYVREKLISELI